MRPIETVAIIGAGAVGCFYGARIARAGYRVRFLMRRDYEAVKRNGLFVHSIDGDFHLAADAYEHPEQIGPVDLAICSVKTTSLNDARPLLTPVVGPDTRVLALMNGLGVEEKIAEWFDPAHVLGGLAFVCINRQEPGHVHHLDYGRVLIGHMRGDAGEAERVARLFRDAGLETSTSDGIKRARWQKLLWNIPFNTLSVTAGGVTTDRIVGDPGLLELAQLLMDEVMAGAAADGAALEPHLPRKMVDDTVRMAPYKTSMLIDYENRQPLELEYILAEPIRRAEAGGVAVPHMKSQYWLARFLDERNRA